APAQLAPNTGVTITDSGFSPANLTVPLGSTVTWVNQGTDVHTATTVPGSGGTAFDTGGLSPNQSASVTFPTAGAFIYSSATDCLNGNKNAGFNCADSYIITVGLAQPAAATQPAAVPQPLPASTSPTVPPVPVASTIPTAAPATNTTITIDDAQGFQPSTLNITVGQTVTWENTGTIVHTATSVPGDPQGFDSGGLSHGQRFSFTFGQPGVYPYRSITEPVYTTDAAGNVVLTYQFTGTITVSQ
ncbi:MAG: hypothetical protein ACYDAG_06145, partial [Chloroflexota bacterium]